MCVPVRLGLVPNTHKWSKKIITKQGYYHQSKSEVRNYAGHPKIKRQIVLEDRYAVCKKHEGCNRKRNKHFVCPIPTHKSCNLLYTGKTGSIRLAVYWKPKLPLSEMYLHVVFIMILICSYYTWLLNSAAVASFYLLCILFHIKHAVGSRPFLHVHVLLGSSTTSLSGSGRLLRDH